MNSKRLLSYLLSFFHLHTLKSKQFENLGKLVTENFKTIINTKTSFFARAQICSLPREVVSREKKLLVTSVFPVWASSTGKWLVNSSNWDELSKNDEEVPLKTRWGVWGGVLIQCSFEESYKWRRFMWLYGVGLFCYRISPSLLSVLFCSHLKQFAVWLKVTTVYSVRDNESLYCSVSSQAFWYKHVQFCIRLDFAFDICLMQRNGRKDTRSRTTLMFWKIVCLIFMAVWNTEKIITITNLFR